MFTTTTQAKRSSFASYVPTKIGSLGKRGWTYVILTFFIGGLLAVAFFKWSSFSNTERASFIVSTTNTAWRVTGVRMAAEKELERVSVYDAKLLYAIRYEPSGLAFFRSNDNGNSWSQAGTLNDLISVDKILFASLENGFLAGRARSKTDDQVGNQTVLVRTTDGGRSWTSVHASTQTSISYLTFSSSGVGIATGRRDTNSDTTNFVLISRDFGKTWLDTSDSLNRIGQLPNGRIEDMATNAIIQESKLVVLSASGRIYSTTNYGETWFPLSKLDRISSSGGFWKMGAISEDVLWVAGTARSVDDLWGMVAVQSGRGTWQINRLLGYSFSDIRRLSGREFVAIAKGTSDKKAGQMVVYSPDAGESWFVVWSNDGSCDLASIFVVSPTRVFILGNTGDGVLIERRESRESDLGGPGHGNEVK